MGTYQKTKVIQSYLRIWGRYDPIELDPSDPKKWGLYGCSVKNADFGLKYAKIARYSKLLKVSAVGRQLINSVLVPD